MNSAVNFFLDKRAISKLKVSIRKYRPKVGVPGLGVRSRLVGRLNSNGLRVVFWIQAAVEERSYDKVEVAQFSPYCFGSRYFDHPGFTSVGAEGRGQHCRKRQGSQWSDCVERESHDHGLVARAEFLDDDQHRG